MTEQNLEISTTVKNGKEYKNLYLKPNVAKRTFGLDDGKYIIVEKVYPEGFKQVSSQYKDKDGNPSVSYSVKANYKGQEVSFFINEEQHEKFKNCGGVGDKVKITASHKKGQSGKVFVNLAFEKVE